MPARALGVLGVVQQEDVRQLETLYHIVSGLFILVAAVDEGEVEALPPGSQLAKGRSGRRAHSHHVGKARRDLQHRGLKVDRDDRSAVL